MKFHIQTRDISKGDKISFRIFDNDSIFLTNNELSLEPWYPNQEIVIEENGMAYIEWQLGEGTASYIKKEIYDYEIEYYVECTYKNEVEDLANEKDEWLRVTLAPTKQKLIFVQASDIHELPEMYDAKTGDIFVMGIKSLMNANKIRGLATTIEESPTLNFAEKKAYEILVRRLERGTMVRTDGVVSSTRRLYTYEVSNLDRTFTKKIKMGVNFRGTKGLNQIEALADKTTPVKLLLKIGGIMRIMGSLFDLATMVKAQTNGELPPIPYMPPFITWHIDEMMEDINNEVRKIFYTEMREAIAKGKDATQKFFWKTSHYEEELKMGFRFISLSEYALYSLLDGQILKIVPNKPEDFDGIELTHIDNLEFIDSSDRSCGMVIQTKEELDEYERTTLNHYIFTLFLPEIIEK